MTLLENVEHVLEAVADLRDLRNRLAELDEERTMIEERIRRRLVEIAGAASTTAGGEPDAAPPNSALHPGMTSPLVNATLASRGRVLETVKSAHGRVITAPDIAAAWGRTGDESTINSIRAALSRLAAAGKIRKVGYGKYAASLGGETAA
jgi:hypothetical protein